MDIVDLIAAAQEWADQGVPVFPCNSSKRPLTKHGHLDAVTDPKAVAELFEFFGNSTTYIGARMGKDSGLFAIDFDLYKGPKPQAYMDMLVGKGILPNTRIHRTKNGGVHAIYHSDTSWPNVIPEVGVEVKGEGGYIIVPPSEGYTVVREGVTEAPGDLIAILMEAKKAASAQNIDALKMKILDASEFHSSLLAISAKWSKRGIPVETILEDLRDILSKSVARDVNHERHKRWAFLYYNESNELTRLIGQGSTKYNPNVKEEEYLDAMEGQWDQVEQTASKHFLPPPEGKQEEPAPKQIEDFGTGWPFEGQGFFAHEDRDLLNQEFIIEGLFAENEVTIMYADPKVGKTALNLTLSLHKSCGMDLGELKMHGANPCLYYALEGKRAIEMRIDAWKRHHREEGVELPDHIPMFTVERPTNFLKEETRIEECNKIIAANNYCLKKYGKPLGIISLDTLTRAMSGGDQNSVDDTSSLFELVGLLRMGGVTASIVIVHHKGKSGQLRGSTNLLAEADLALDITKEGPLIRARVAEARSMEEGGIFSFNTKTIVLGINKQGIELSSFVLTPATNVGDIKAEDYTDSIMYANVMDCLLQFGKGKHDLSRALTLVIKENLFSTTSKGKPSKRNAEVQEFFQTTIPPEGRIYSGHAFNLIRNESGMAMELHIREVSE